MASLRAAMLCILLGVLLPFQTVLAGEEEPIVWVADGVNLKGKKTVVLYPATNETGEELKFDSCESVTGTIQSELLKSDVKVISPGKKVQPEGISVKPSLVGYQAGDVGGRWIGFGGGAAICVLRTFIYDEPSGNQIAEIILAEQVASGGLFSIGAEKYVPKRAAAKIATEILILLGIEVKPEPIEYEEEESETWY
jgi:hypothetical protein